MVETERKVSRVLVMLEYGEGDPHNGEVFDLTALCTELTGKNTTHRHARLQLAVSAFPDYAKSTDKEPVTKTTLNWNAMVDFKFSGDAAYLEDAINASLPPSPATMDLLQKLAELQKATEEVNHQITAQKLRDAVTVRHLHPIARVTQAPVLPDVAAATALPIS